MGFCDIADICARMDAHEGQAAWAQAFGAVLALAIAVGLPRLDRWRAKREYGEAAVAAASYAHQQIAAVWGIAHGLAEQRHARTEDFVDELARAARELEAFSLLGAQSVQAVVYMRQLAACCRGTAEIAGDPSDQRKRSHGVAGYAHHLLVLIARELHQPEPPPPFSTDGVPPEIVDALKRGRVGRFRLNR